MLVSLPRILLSSGSVRRSSSRVEAPHHADVHVIRGRIDRSTCHSRSNCTQRGVVIFAEVGQVMHAVQRLIVE